MEAKTDGRCWKREEITRIKDEAAIIIVKISEENIKTQERKIVIIGKHKTIIISNGEIIIDIKEKIKNR